MTVDIQAPGSIGAGAISAEALISEVVTAGSQASVTYSSIPATWRDIRVVVRGRGDTAAVNSNLLLQFNGDTGANYHEQHVLGQAAAAGGGITLAGTSIFLGQLPAATPTANVAGGGPATILDYRGATFQQAAHHQQNLKN